MSDSRAGQFYGFSKSEGYKANIQDTLHKINSGILCFVNLNDMPGSILGCVCTSTLSNMFILWVYFKDTEVTHYDTVLLLKLAIECKMLCFDRVTYVVRNHRPLSQVATVFSLVIWLRK